MMIEDLDRVVLFNIELFLVLFKEKLLYSFFSSEYNMMLRRKIDDRYLST